jgi:sulfate transport system permease protein
MRLPRSIIPGFLPTMGITLAYLSLIVLIPLAGLVLKSTEMSLSQFLTLITDSRVLAAFKISFGISILAGLISSFFGLIVAWVLVRYRFPGRRIIDAVIDLPFAMPTAVSGITLANLYSEHGWIGSFLHQLGIKVAFTPLGILVALVFIGFPFIVRGVEPVLHEMDKDMEEAAACLGASRAQTIKKIIFPQLTPSLIAGFTMAVSRALGEYGSVIFIAGNIPYISEIVPLLIIIKLEQFDYLGATALAVIMLLASFVMLLIINLFQVILKRRFL